MVFALFPCSWDDKKMSLKCEEANVFKWLLPITFTEYNVKPIEVPRCPICGLIFEGYYFLTRSLNNVYFVSSYLLEYCKFCGEMIFFKENRAALDECHCFCCDGDATIPFGSKHTCKRCSYRHVMKKIPAETVHCTCCLTSKRKQIVKEFNCMKGICGMDLEVGFNDLVRRKLYNRNIEKISDEELIADEDIERRQDKFRLDLCILDIGKEEPDYIEDDVLTESSPYQYSSLFLTLSDDREGEKCEYNIFEALKKLYDESDSEESDDNDASKESDVGESYYSDGSEEHDHAEKRSTGDLGESLSEFSEEWSESGDTSVKGGSYSSVSIDSLSYLGKIRHKKSWSYPSDYEEKEVDYDIFEKLYAFHLKEVRQTKMKMFPLKENFPEMIKIDEDGKFSIVQRKGFMTLKKNLTPLEVTMNICTSKMLAPQDVYDKIKKSEYRFDVVKNKQIELNLLIEKPLVKYPKCISKEFDFLKGMKRIDSETERRKECKMLADEIVMKLKCCPRFVVQNSSERCSACIEKRLAYVPPNITNEKLRTFPQLMEPCNFLLFFFPFILSHL